MVKCSFARSSRLVNIILCCCIASLTVHYLTAGLPQVVDSFWQHVLDENSTNASDASDHHSDDNVMLPDLPFVHHPGGLTFLGNNPDFNRIFHHLSHQLPPPQLDNLS
jgi:hypothetical protein